MTRSARKIRGRPFKPGNPGRPLGSKNKTTLFVEHLAEGEAEQLIQKLLELAKAGDVSCLKLALDRLWPVRKSQPINVDLPAIRNQEDVLAAIVALWSAIREGRLTCEEASALSLVAERSLEVLQAQEVLRRIKDLEERTRPTPGGKIFNGGLMNSKGARENRLRIRSALSYSHITLVV
jgi:hypothetical protein